MAATGKKPSRNEGLAYYFLSKNKFNLLKSKREFASYVRKKYNACYSNQKLDTIFNKVIGDLYEPGVGKSLRMQVLVTAQDVLQTAKENFDENGDTQEMIDALKFMSEVVGLIQTGHGGNVNIFQDNSQNTNMEFNVDEILAGITTGIDRISPILQRLNSIGGLNSGESPFLLHPSRETEGIINIPSEGDMGDGRKPKR